MGSKKSKPEETQRTAIRPLPRPTIEPSRKLTVQNPTTPPPRRSLGPNPDHGRAEPRLSREMPRADLNNSGKLGRPQNQLPIRPSWLHQNNMNERYNHVEPVGTGDYDDEYLHRRQIAINRWQHDDLDSETTKKSKSFFDEYIHP